MARIKYELDPALTFEQAKATADKLQADWSAAGNALSAFADPFGKGPMGLTPDHVRAMPEWRTLYNAMEQARVRAQHFGTLYQRRFKKEIRDDVMARRAAKIKANQEKVSDQAKPEDQALESGEWPNLEPLHLQALMFAYNEGYSKAFDGRVFPNPFSESGSQADAWVLGTREGGEARQKSQIQEDMLPELRLCAFALATSVTSDKKATTAMKKMADAMLKLLNK